MHSVQHMNTGLKVDVQTISEISENSGKLRIALRIHFTWSEGRLRFFNLWKTYMASSSPSPASSSSSSSSTSSPFLTSSSYPSPSSSSSTSSSSPSSPSRTSSSYSSPSSSSSPSTSSLSSSSSSPPSSSSSFLLNSLSSKEVEALWSPDIRYLNTELYRFETLSQPNIRLEFHGHSSSTDSSNSSNSSMYDSIWYLADLTSLHSASVIDGKNIDLAWSTTVR